MESISFTRFRILPKGFQWIQCCDISIFVSEELAHKYAAEVVAAALEDEVLA